ncbi:pentapeptide repeat-containing protein [Microbispora sp. H10670]|uniref:pentapeptide repeat-containing protein n=1 Tax=Microbispora sp. H10670 TaxID=2729108 RepID=UPI001601289C|nr:pentapeptide repeat-containing protein [Microbispora sp. H10670]
MWISTTILLNEASVVTNNNLELAKLRSEAIRTGLTVGAGTGGAVALLLSMRRQWLSERAQKHQEEVSAVTELYSKAVEQLGSDKAPVRLAALYALERLADDHVHQRQTIVNVLCAYLRMPFESPRSPKDLDDGQDIDPDVSAPLMEEYRRGRQEMEVRKTAQRILANHLGHVDAGDVLQWKNVDLDLNHATLLSADFRGCRIRKADFQYAEFHGATLFEGAQFAANANFANAKFNIMANFDGVRFEDDARFTSAFFSEVSFTGSQFYTLADYDWARFYEEATFKHLVVAGEFWFQEASAFDVVYFSGSDFHQAADFSRSKFHEELWLDSATFMSSAYFLDVHARLATFDKAIFAGTTRFKRSIFVEVSFDEAQFHASATLDGLKYDSIHTLGCRFYGPPSTHSAPNKLKLSMPAGSDYSSLVPSESSVPTTDVDLQDGPSTPDAEPEPKDPPEA